jgi:hypothetical protein
MKNIIIVMAIAAALWYGFMGRKLSEADVYNTYNESWSAFHDEDPKRICALIDDRYQAKVKNITPIGVVEETVTRQAACSLDKGFHAVLKQAKAKTGQELFMNSEYSVKKIDLSPDGKQATVQVVSIIRIGTEQRLHFKLTETSTDTLVKSMGKTKFLSSESSIEYE